jgi:hypothetical protein
MRRKVALDPKKLAAALVRIDGAYGEHGTRKRKTTCANGQPNRAQADRWNRGLYTTHLAGTAGTRRCKGCDSSKTYESFRDEDMPVFNHADGCMSRTCASALCQVCLDHLCTACNILLVRTCPCCNGRRTAARKKERPPGQHYSRCSGMTLLSSKMLNR